MAGWGRLLGACVAAAAVAAAAGGVLVLIGMVVLAQIHNPGVGIEGPVGGQITGAVNGLYLAAVLSLLMGFVPALCGAVGVLLPLHLVLARNGRGARAWYLAAGCAAGVISILLARQAFGYLDWWAQVAGFGGLLASAALGGPVGALVFRRIVLRPQAATGA